MSKQGQGGNEAQARQRELRLKKKAEEDAREEARKKFQQSAEARPNLLPGLKP